VALNKRLVNFALAKQTAKGSAAANPTFEVGVTGGKLLDPAIQEEDLSVTSTDRITADRERLAVAPTAQAGLIAMPKSLGLLLLDACGSVTTTGSGPYTHTFKTAADLPYNTLWAHYAGLYYKMADAKLDELALSWDKTGHLKAEAKYLGLDLVPLASAYTAATSELPASGYMRGMGGAFTVDGAAARVIGGNIKVNNGVTHVPGSTAVLPDDVWPGAQVIEFEFTLMPDNLNEFRKVLTGAVGGTTIASAPFTAAVSFTWKHDANTDLVFAAPRAVLMVEFPDADPEGGPAEVPLVGRVLKPAAGDPYTFVLRNAQVSY
jgi:hypothetical protein